MSSSIAEARGAVATDTAGIVESLIQRGSQIATLPAVAVQIIRVTEDPDSTVEDLNRVIANDPALGVRILKLVNSSYYGMPGQIGSITRALHLLGLRAVKNIAIAASLSKLFRGGAIDADFDAGDIWLHSIAVAAGSRMLAMQVAPVLADEAFLAGLIHDMGILIEMQANGPKFGQMIRMLAADPGLSFRKAEEATFGATHEEFGAGLCKAWHFPPSFQVVTGFHHRPWDVDKSHRLLPTIVHLADVLAARLELGYTRTVESDAVDPLLLGEINLTEDQFEAIAEKLPEEVQQANALLSDVKSSGPNSK